MIASRPPPRGVAVLPDVDPVTLATVRAYERSNEVGHGAHRRRMVVSAVPGAVPGTVAGVGSGHDGPPSTVLPVAGILAG